MPVIVDNLQDIALVAIFNEGVKSPPYVCPRASATARCIGWDGPDPACIVVVAVKYIRKLLDG